MAATSAMYDMAGDTINPNLTMQDNADLNSYFNDMEPAATSTNSTWGGMDQFLDFNTNTEFPFPQTQNRPPSGIPPQAVNPFMAGPMNNGLMPVPTYAHGLPVSAGGFFPQTAAPSALMDTQNPGHSTHQATGSSQKRPRDPTDNNEASAESTEKKPRKQRKKRSKQLSEAEANEKRQKFLDRNKVAAHKCRQRKKEWTDNLQNKASLYQHENETLKAEVMEAYQIMSLMKRDIELCRIPGGVHAYNCTGADYEKAWEEFKKREEAGFVNEASIKLQQRIAQRKGEDNEGEGSLDMSRQTSMQSARSGYEQPGRNERHDSGVSVGANTPEDSKTHGTPKASVDEGIDLGNGRNFFGSMMPNQRLGMWHNEPIANGPDDLMDPAVYLGLTNN